MFLNWYFFRFLVRKPKKADTHQQQVDMLMDNVWQ